MGLTIFNVLGREKQPFYPINEGQVGIYVCGPTIYDHSHLGHAKTYLSFDMIVRWLRHQYQVLYVQNLTDVGHLLATEEDRIVRKARQMNAKPMQVADYYMRSYMEDMTHLHVMPPDIQPRAAGHVPEQIDMIAELLDKEFAYEVNGSVYFDVTADPDYGKLSNCQLDAQFEDTRQTLGMQEKRHPADFALWKRAEPEHIMRWRSPWSDGFPGWHIECSAMARKYLGPTFDIHGGGVDNIFPHNECEIAQSESANDQPFANYWILIGSLNVPDEDGNVVKMSKSLGNFVTIKSALDEYRPEVIRMFVLSIQYSKPITYSPESMTNADNAWKRIYQAVRLTRYKMNSAKQEGDGQRFIEAIEKVTQGFTHAMNDDFNTPEAIAALQGFTNEVNTLLHSDIQVSLDVLNAIDETYRTFAANILGIIPEYGILENANATREKELIDILIDLRAQARQAKNYTQSDSIRDRLVALGVHIDDRPEGSVWHID